MADQLATLAQVKARIPIAVGDTSDDALINELIDQVSEYIAERTGRKLVPDNAATYLFDTQAGSVIRVHRGIRSVTAIGVASSDQPDSGGTYTALTPATDVLLRPSPAELRPGWPPTLIYLTGKVGRLVTALNGVTITGNFGFATTPLEITAVAIDAVVAAYHARSGASEVIGADANAIEPWARFFSEGTAQAATIARYKAGAGIGIA